MKKYWADDSYVSGVRSREIVSPSRGSRRTLFWRGTALSLGAALALGMVSVFALTPTPLPAYGAPGTPGVPQAGKTTFLEDFQNAQARTPIEEYQGGASSGNARYDADPAWKQTYNGCNGWVMNPLSTSSSQDGGCVNNNGWGWTMGQRMAFALGKAQGMSDSQANANYVLIESTNRTNSTQEAGVLLKSSGSTITVTEGRYYAVSAYFAAMSCSFTSNPPSLTFSIILGGTTHQLSTGLNPCNSTMAGFSPYENGVNVAYVTSAALKVTSGGTVGMQLENATAHGGGNDSALDAVSILDVSPQVDQAFSPSVTLVGGASTWIVTITNTSDLLAKNGWSFSAPLPSGLSTTGSPTTTCSGGSPTMSSGTLSMSGNLNQGQSSCTVSVPVTTSSNGTYTSNPSNFTLNGLDSPLVATLSTSQLNLSAAVNPQTVSVVGAPVQYTFTVSNPSSVPVNNLVVTAGGSYTGTTQPGFSGTGTLSPISCTPTSIAASGTATCTASYSLTQADIDAGQVLLTARASATPTGTTLTTQSNTSPANVTVNQSTGLLLSAADPGKMTRAGEPVNYQFTVTNTGSTTVSGLSIVRFSFTGSGTPPPVTCQATTLAPGASTTCTASYNATPADLDAREIVLTVDAVGTAPTGQVVSNRVAPRATYVPQIVNIVYVDDDANGASVTPKPGSTTQLSGSSGDPVGFTEAMARTAMPQGYAFVRIDNVAVFDSNDNVDQTITVHLRHDHSTAQIQVSRTITYVGAGASTPAAVVQPSTWTATTDLVTGTIIYTTTSSGYPAVDTPVLDGFTADTARVPAVALATPTGERPVSTTVTVAYAPNAQLVNVVYVDDDANGNTVEPVTGTLTSLVGASGTAIGFTETMARAGMPTGYTFVGIDNLSTFDFNDAVDQTITVHLAHGHSTAQLPVTRTIDYVGAGASTPADVVQTVTWIATTDLVTNVVVYTTASTGYPAVTSPTVGGYTPDILTVPVVSLTSPTQQRPTSTTVTVTYGPNQQVVNVIYIDDDASGALVEPVTGTVTRLVGASGSSVGFTEAAARAGIPSGYVFVWLDNVATYDYIDSEDQTITVRLAHGYSTTSLSVSRTIDYVGAGAATPADVVQPMTWAVTTNLVTGTIVYTTTSSGYPAVDSPAVDGYQPSVNRVPILAVTSPTSQKPVSSIVTVTYSPKTQAVDIVYVDDDTSGTVVEPAAGATTRLTGTGGTAVGYTEVTARAGVPQGYVFVTVDNVTTYDFVDAVDQTITVHLIHGYSDSQLVVSRTVHYSGAGSATPANVVQSITWKATTNLVTGVVVYTTTSTGYPAVKSPWVDGYASDIDQVPVVPVTSPTQQQPTPLHAWVTYSPTTQVANVIFVDDDANHKRVTVTGVITELTGPSGAAVGYTEQNARSAVPAGYVFASLDNVATFDYVDAVDQTITVHLRHGYSSAVLTVSRTVHYVGAGTATPVDVVQQITWTATTNLVTGHVVYTTTSTGYPLVSSPRVDGYEPDIFQVPVLGVTTPTDVTPTSVTVTVTYAPTIQAVNVMYVDDDASGKVVAPAQGVPLNNGEAGIRLTGPSGSPIGFTEQNAKDRMPQGYAFMFMNNIATYDFIDSEDQLIVVHLTHAHSVVKLTVTRTIEYVGAGKATPRNVVQPITWTKTTDMVTNVVVYTTASTAYPTANSPAVDGYSVDLAQVPAGAVTSPADVEPVSTTVTVNYSPIPIIVPTGGRVISE